MNSATLKALWLTSLLLSYGGCLRSGDEVESNSCAQGGCDGRPVINEEVGQPGGLEAPPLPASTNGRPSLSRIGDKVISVGDELTIQLMASDPQNDPLTFLLRTDLPEGADFNGDSATFIWAPVASQAGMRFLLTFEVSDGMLKDQETISVEVTNAGETQNLPPQIDLIGDQRLIVGQPWSYQVQASDPNGDPLMYSIGGRLVPEALIFDQELGSMSWTPSAEDEGEHELIITVSDGELEATLALRLVVTSDQDPMADPPRFIEQPPVEVTLGETVSFRLQAQYAGSDPLTFSMEQSPEASASFDPSTQTFTWTPSAAQAYEVVFMVTDGRYRDHMQVQIIVNLDGPPPVPGGECPSDPDTPGQSVAISSGSNLMGRVLCEVEEEDVYTFSVGTASTVELEINFEIANDLDLYLYDSSNQLIASSEGVIDFEKISDLLQPGDYRAKVTLYSGSAATYSIQLTLTPNDVVPAICTDDRLEPNNSPAQAQPLALELYADLSACGDDDWYSTNVDDGYPLIIYLSSDDPDVSMFVRDATGDVAGVTRQSMPPGADGCRGRAHCARIEAFMTNTSTYYYRPDFTQQGVEYDLRVRFGDEVSSPCNPAVSTDCNPGYVCIDSFNGVLFPAGGTCTRSCVADSECGGSNRACIAEQNSTSGKCFQTCSSNSDCRSGFICSLETSVEGPMRAVCR